jgi:hypothetical protein
MRYTDLLIENFDADSFGEHVKNLAAKQRGLPPGDPMHSVINKIMDQTALILAQTQPLEENTAQPMNMPPADANVEISPGNTVSTAPIAAPATPPAAKKRQSGAIPNKELVYRASAVTIDAAARMFMEQNPDSSQVMQQFMEFVAQADTKLQLQKDPDVIKATTATVKGIQLNTKAELGKLDADIEKVALGFADRFNLPDIWARNLVGMFGTRITGDKRKKFLQACEAGKALDISSMIKKGQGNIDEVVSIDDPAIKDVYKDVKRTLLDISLSTGQRGATGPFEAMLAIMGGARKPKSDEGGDLVVQRGNKITKLEVKSGSLTPSSKLLKDGTLPNTGKATQAWLDSMEGKEISGSRLRREADAWLSHNTNIYRIKPIFDKADFRPGGIAAFAQVLNALDKSKPGTSEAFMKHLMLSVFPSIKQAPGYNFPAACRRLVNAIKDMETDKVAREQGVMSLLEYHLGKGNDGFIFFNSSTQEYKMIMGAKDIVGLLNQKSTSKDSEEESMLRFSHTMTFSGDRCSPGAYFGPAATSKRAKEYFAEYNSDPKRIQLRREAAAREQADAGHEDSEFQRTRSPRPKTR